MLTLFESWAPSKPISHHKTLEYVGMHVAIASEALVTFRVPHAPCQRQTPSACYCLI